MNLEPGLMLGKHRLVEKIGEGGMGVVWRGIDTSLDREVAIKVLPDHFSSDAERLARFEREAKLLASLNHPGIATIHGFHDVDGVRFLAMELVGGMDLAQRLSTGPMPIEEVLEAGLQMATALESAHESGVVHRDLKPANVKLNSDGKIKILDFGLAKALERELPEGGSLSPTLTTPATRVGVIMGTAAYMSPEQAKGKPADRRADIWAFGCVMYEMLTGKRPFSGDGVSEILAAVIMSPVALETLPAGLPASVRRLLGRCLEKDPHRRLRDIGEARFVIEEALSGRAETIEPGAPAGAPAVRRISIPVLAAGMILAGVIGAALLRAFMPQAPSPPLRRFEVAAEGPRRSGLSGRLVAISPDGGNLAYVGGDRLMVRPLDRLEPIPIETRSGPDFLFWSPDSAWIAYAEGGKLWKAPAGGGPSAIIADLPEPALVGGSGGSWGPDGQIAITCGTEALYSVPARGGDFQVLVRVDPGKEESDFHEPHYLPDGSMILTVHRTDGRPDRLELLADGVRTTLLSIEGQDLWYPVYSTTGHILYRRHPANPGLWALPYAMEQRRVTGEPFLVSAEGDLPSVSADGTLVHVASAAARQTQMVWTDREGRILGPIGQPQDHWPFPELSPDERYLAIVAFEGGSDAIWLHDVERGTRTRLTFGDSDSLQSVSWSTSGDRIFFSDGVNPPFAMKARASDGSGGIEDLGSGVAPFLSPDGKYLLYAAQTEDTGWDLWYRDMETEEDPVRFLTAVGDQFWPRVSPGGDHVAYTSFETGSAEVYVKPFPSGPGKWQVSTDGGSWQRWSHDGKRLYYVREETIMEVDVSTGPSIRLGKPRAIFTREPLGRSLVFGWSPGFDVSDDDRRFVIAAPVGEEGSTGIIVVENWIAGLASD